MIISWLLTIVSCLLGVAFLTLLERKVLSFSQIRLGPNKVSWLAILQPILDGVKLLVKPTLIKKHHLKLLYLYSAIIRFIFNLILWLVVMFSSFEISEYQFLWLICILGLRAYVVLLAGWSSFSKYSFIGAIRSLAQALSYEVVLTLLIFLPFLKNQRFSFFSLLYNAIFLILFWVIIFVLETQRAPFDLREGERELVSGFNTEYGRLLFIYFFLAEYGNILVLSLVLVLIWYKLRIMIMFFVIVWLLLRSSYPRVRYDFLIGFLWFLILPARLLLWIFYMNF